MTEIIDTYCYRAYIRSMKFWSRFFVIVAYSFALLHTAVPHQHAALSDGETTIAAADCSVSYCMTGFLKSIFSTDLGYGHLETFQKGSDGDVDLSFAGAFSVLALLVPFHFSKEAASIRSAFFAGFIEKLHKRLVLFSTTHFRAPPAVA